MTRKERQAAAAARFEALVEDMLNAMKDPEASWASVRHRATTPQTREFVELAYLEARSRFEQWHAGMTLAI